MAPNLRQQNKEALRRRLYETALELFDTQGYEGTTVAQITERAGVAKGTFFNHFPTKEHVVLEWYNAITFESLAAARQREVKSAEQAICDLCVDMSRRATDAPELLLAKARNGAHPLLMEAEKVQDDESDAYFLEQVRLGKAEGELRDDLDAQFFVDLVGAVLTGSARAWVRTPAAFDLPTTIRRRLQFLFQAAKSGERA